MHNFSPDSLEERKICTQLCENTTNVFKVEMEKPHTHPYDSIATVKGKAIPLQAWTGPEGSRGLRPPDFKTIGR
jgi:hypothetical protein